MARYILKTRAGGVPLNRDGSELHIREFWCPGGSGGYVYEVDEDHPGTTGRQVSDSLSYPGCMLTADETTLAERIQRGRRMELAEARLQDDY